MAFQTHYNFGGAKTHNGGSKSAAKKALKQFWQYIQGQGAQLNDPITVSQITDLQRNLLSYGSRMVNSYRVCGGAYDTTLTQYVTDCCGYLDQFITSDTAHLADGSLPDNRQAFMVKFEHRVNQLIRRYETVITKG